ncbi:hypothetical protein [Peribacillus kribbensis]|nr:hypothetical protein [Peribacillus kribbensis]
MNQEKKQAIPKTLSGMACFTISAFFIGPAFQQAGSLMHAAIAV